MLAEHTTQELELWSQIKKQVLRKIHESQFESDIQCHEVDGQFILTRKRSPLRRVVLSFTSQSPDMNVHFERDDAPPLGALMLRVDGNRLINCASNAPMAVNDLATKCSDVSRAVDADSSTGFGSIFSPCPLCPLW